MTPSTLMVTATAALAGVTLWPRLVASRSWRAMATPLASIIGSGFLVAGPVLGEAAGRLALPAMLGLCAVGWLFGSAIRTNIRHAEPLLDGGAPPEWLLIMERISNLALALAYFVSVAYYLNLFAAFGLRIAGLHDELMIRIVSSAITGLLGAIGLLRGLHWLENIEVPAVGVKLALIAGLELGLAFATWQAAEAGTLAWPASTHPTGFREIQILLGLVILVQGFETSRYLGHAYPAELRIRTMRRAQLLATLIYGIFIALVTPYIVTGLPARGTETAIIDLLRPVGWAIPILLIMTALASQLSAAVADMNGAGGLIGAGIAAKVSDKWGYAITALVAVLITWSANILEIIVYASKAFVIYYGLQSAIAAVLCLRKGSRHPYRAACYGLGILVALAVLAFGVPAEAQGAGALHEAHRRDGI